ncbi:MAG: single-stranded DNA-binding protein [Deltaproteobacteria bacterium]|nr:single-stranded DNA-binding protein [Deltaproteobacteria bacterium]
MNPAVRAARALCRDLEPLVFGAPTTHVYNPLVYAWAPHAQYLERFGAEGPRDVVLLGMNPGPWGMAQTGVPFGEVSLVRDWLGISGRVDKPAVENPARPISGFACTKSEVSGARLWGWARAQYGRPERFFKTFFVANYCPLVFMEESGKNRTPDKLPAAEREPLLDACDRALRALVVHLRPRLVVGVGVFAEGRARAALADLDVEVGRVLHPSPASPAANRGWAEQAQQTLASLGVSVPAGA